MTHSPSTTKPEIVPPRVTDKMHGTISQKYIPTARGPRDTEPPREFHPKSLVSNVCNPFLEY